MADNDDMPEVRPVRKPVSAGLRFEVFKRDKFTCQYCGRAAPEVVLNCDHVRPVADGGDNDPLNLITSCKACNGGKGAVPLGDTAVIDRQHAMLAELEERRQQLEMMLRWRDELQNLAGDVVEEVCARIAERGPGFTPDPARRLKVKQWLKSFTLSEILAAVDLCFDQYLCFEDGRVTMESWIQAFAKIPGVVRVTREAEQKPYLPKLFYIQAIIRNKTSCRVDIAYLEHIHLCGATLDDIQRDAKRREYITHFMKAWDAWLNEIDEPYPSGRGWS